MSSPSGPQVSVPGCTSLGWLRLRQSDGISWIWLNENALAMAGSADIARAEDGVRSGLPLDREHPLLGVGRAVVDVVSGNAADRLVGAPVDVGIGIAARRIQRGKRVGKGLAIVLPVGCGNERRREERRQPGWYRWCRKERSQPARRSRAHRSRCRSCRSWRGCWCCPVLRASFPGSCRRLPAATRPGRRAAKSYGC